MSKLATVKVCFLEYNARSLNGRIYPKATCDAIFQAAQAKIAQDDLPATVFINHQSANSDSNRELVGKVARVWQEANRFYADLELADTSVARDMLALVESKTLRSESMRVAGVELRYLPEFDLPVVVVQEGCQVDFRGIDFTTNPGLADVARIQQVLYEDEQDQQAYIEEFTVENVTVESKQEEQEPTVPPAQQEDSQESIQSQGETSMELTPEQIQEALRLAAEQGYTVAPPKTPEQKLQEALDAKLAEQRQQMEEAFNAKLAALQPTTPPARQTLSNSQQLQEDALQPEKIYEHGDYLQESLQPKNWRALANRQVPWPAGMHPKDALRELAPFMATRLLEQDANAQGKSVEMLVRQDEQI